jgi:hypothetical protein
MIKWLILDLGIFLQNWRMGHHQTWKLFQDYSKAYSEEFLSLLAAPQSYNQS